MRTRVKICGFTDAEEAVFAAKAGVDAIGLVFYEPSPRHLSIERAVKIVNALPAFVSVVALFVDELEETINKVLEKVPVDCLQFHGNEEPEACRKYGKRYIKAVRMRQNTDISLLSSLYADADGLLLDAYHPGIQGGTGDRFDWDLVPKQCNLPIILAGGLDATNVITAIEQTSPYAVDVSSGVELGKGIKDKNKIAAFMSAVHQGNTITL
ncbi:MAG: phosphoribosylanthranilate isomerase [Methylococcaceae bacterium]|nr:phosphoribosylanthranilate isomerase [Methylococcaceae bacterium]